MVNQSTTGQYGYFWLLFKVVMVVMGPISVFQSTFGVFCDDLYTFGQDQLFWVHLELYLDGLQVQIWFRTTYFLLFILLVTFQGSYGPISVVTVDCSLVVLIGYKYFKVQSHSFKVSYNLVMIPMLYDGLDSKQDSLCLRICRIFLAYEGGRKEEGKKDI